MEIIKTHIKDLVIIQPKVFNDDRGYFMETFKSSFFKDHFPDINFIQENESSSKFGVLRGLHFQSPPYSQSKLVRVIKGKVLDVAVDLRYDSETYGKHFKLVLSGKNKKQFFIPKGFAHGFLVLSKKAIFNYKVDNYYNSESDSGIIYSDPDIAIDWDMPLENIRLSPKDKHLGKFKSFKTPF